VQADVHFLQDIDTLPLMRTSEPHSATSPVRRRNDSPPPPNAADSQIESS
jgi:hypothetical protein